jgi:AcrR family transcriptional regulator
LHVSGPAAYLPRGRYLSNDKYLPFGKSLSLEEIVSETARETAPRRSPTAGGYARGEETRARIISAALKVFGDEGYERASTRRIAREAGVMPPALQYYFDSKEGLHLACGQFIIDISTQGFAVALENAEAILAEGGAPDAAHALCDVLDTLLDASLFARGSPDWERFAARIQSERDSPAGALIQRKIAAPLRDICARLVAQATGTALNDEARLRAIAIIGQVSAFHVYREGALQLLGWRDFNGPRRDTIKAVLRAHTQAALNLS